MANCRRFAGAYQNVASIELVVRIRIKGLRMLRYQGSAPDR